MLNRSMTLALALCIIPVEVCFGAAGGVRTLRAIGAGTWYPADTDALRTTVTGFLDGAQSGPPAGRTFTCILPHAPMATAGPLVAEAIKTLPKDRYDRIIFLAPTRFSKFRGCSIPSVQTYVTPLGFVPVDCPAVRELDRNTLIETRTVDYSSSAERVQLHERENAIEGLLPYFQVHFGVFTIIPIVVGDFVDYRGEVDENAMNAVADAIRPHLTATTLVVVASNLTHFGNRFSFRPFRDNIIENIDALDRTAMDLIVNRDVAGFLEYLKATKNTIDGKNAIVIMMKLLPPAASGQVLKYEMSAQKTGNTSASISYAAMAFTGPDDAGAETPQMMHVLKLKRPE